MTDTPASVPSRRRRIAVWALIVLAALVALVGSLSVWVKRQVLDTEAWTEASSTVLANEEVQDALSIRMVDALWANVDVEAELADRLPDELDGLAPAAAAALRTTAVQAAEQLLESSGAQTLWQEINRRAHARLVQVLEGDDGRLTTEEGDVILDLTPLVERLEERLDIDADLPPGAGEITIMHSDQLEAAQGAVRAIKVVSIFVGLVTIALLAAAIYLARGWRREALRGAGAALVTVGVALLVVRRLVGNAIVDELSSPQSEPAVDAIWLTGTDLLQNVAIALLAAGVVAVLAAWVGGPTRPAVWVRRSIAPTLYEHPALVYGGAFLAFLLVLLWGPAETTVTLVGTIVLAGLAVLGIEVLRRQTAREFPPSSP